MKQLQSGHSPPSSPRTAGKRLLALCPVGQPVTGRQVVSVRVRDRCRAAGVLFDVFDYSPMASSRSGVGGVRFPGPLRKLTAALHFRRTLRGMGPGSARPVWGYVALNDGKGLLFDLLAISGSASRLDRLILHHHSRRYIDSPAAAMQRVINISRNANPTHVFQCDLLADRARHAYSGLPACSVFALSNAFVLDEVKGVVDRPMGSPPRVGFIANLTIAKGIVEFLEAARQYKTRSGVCRFLLAGPADRDATGLIQRAVAENLVEYLGPLYGDAKLRFVSSLDVFFFPSAGETEGIVILEALACGCPVIATGIACCDERFETAGVVIRVAGGSNLVRDSVVALDRLLRQQPASTDRGPMRELRADSARLLSAARREALVRLDDLLGLKGDGSSVGGIP